MSKRTENVLATRVPWSERQFELQQLVVVALLQPIMERRCVLSGALEAVAREVRRYNAAIRAGDRMANRP